MEVVEISDEELTALALAADPDGRCDEDAQPFDAGGLGVGLLPSWYMPAPMAHRVGRGRRMVIVGVIAALVLVNAAGLCATFGFPEIAW